MKKLFVLATAFVVLNAVPSYADPPTITEEAAEQCEDPAVVDEFGKGDVDLCYVTMIEEITSYRNSVTTSTTVAVELAEPQVIVSTPIVLAELPRTE